MLKLAYLSFIAAVLAMPAQLIIGGPTTRLIVAALWLLCLASLTMGLLRRP